VLTRLGRNASMTANVLRLEELKVLRAFIAAGTNHLTRGVLVTKVFGTEIGEDQGAEVRGERWTRSLKRSTIPTVDGTS